MEKTRKLFAEAQNIVILTGAGVSTASGIGDFRGPDGLWTLKPLAEQMSSVGVWRKNDKVRREGWQDYVRRFHSETFVPNPAHDAITHLSKTGRVKLLVTQNVDMLHEASGMDPDLIFHVHGEVGEVHCATPGCKWSQPSEDFIERLVDDPDPFCLECRKPCKPGYVMFGENLDQCKYANAVNAFSDADLCITVGTSLMVFPVADLPQKTLDWDQPVVIVNNQPTPLDHYVHKVFREPCETLLPYLMGLTDTPPESRV